MSNDPFGFDFLAPLEPADEPEVIPESDPEDDYRGETRDSLEDDWPHCEDCGVRIEWSGRGRRPKRCHEHRRNVSTRTTGTATVRRTRGKSAQDLRLESIETRLHSSAVKIGMVMGRYAPITGLVFIDRSDRFTSAAVRLSANKPEVLDFLEKIADTAPVFDIAEFIASVIFAVGIDLGRVHPGSIAAQLLGLTKLWEEYNQTPAVQQEPPTAVDESAGVYASPKAPHFGPGPLPTFSPIGEGV